MSQQLISAALKQLYKACLAVAPFDNPEQQTQEDTQFIERFALISDTTTISEATRAEAQSLIATIIASYPHLTAFINRDMLWLLGSDCMHFLSDEEIAHYQHVDELMAENMELSFKDANALAEQPARKH